MSDKPTNAPLTYGQLREHCALQIMLALLGRGDNYDPALVVKTSVSMAQGLLDELYPGNKSLRETP